MNWELIFMWMSEWVNELVSEWGNEWVSELVNVKKWGREGEREYFIEHIVPESNMMLTFF